MDCSICHLPFAAKFRNFVVKIGLLSLAAGIISGWVYAASAQVTVSPTSLSWSTVHVGNAGGPKTATLTNGGSTSITISSITFTGTNAGDFAIYKNTCGTALAASASCAVTALFKPTTSGTRTGTLNFTDSASNSPQQVALTGLGASATSGSVTATPTSLSFGSINTGSVSSAQTITVSNTTAVNLTLSPASFSGANAAEFAVSSSTCGSSLLADYSCTENIIFQPTAGGSASATWNLTSSNSATPLAVTLSGTGVASSGGTAAASPTSLSWNKVAVGNAGGPKVVTLTNSGSASITITSIGFTGADPGDFTVYQKTCGASLAASASCTATILFKPTVSGTRTSTLTLTDSAGNSPQQVSLSGIGTGGTSTVSASPATLAFGSVNDGSTSAPQTITVSNGTASSVTLSSPGISGANATSFAVASTTCGTALAASASCTASVVFEPTAPVADSATWSITSSNSTTPLSVTLSGTGTTGSGSAITVSPTNPTLTEGATQQFTANVNASWSTSCGSISSTGSYTAPLAPEPCTIVATATDGSGHTGSSVASITSPITLTPAQVNLHALNTQQFTASSAVTWTASCGSVSSSGKFTAPASAATCSVTGTASSGTKYTAVATASVDVANYTAWKGGAGGTGAQMDELQLTPSNVNSTSFGVKWSAGVDGWVNAQPLYMNALTVNGSVHNVAFFVTENDSVYAFDGDTGALLWQVSLGTAVASTAVGYTSGPTQIGILGTPVIDPSTNTMYVVSETSEQNATYFPHRLHALDVTTGQEKFGGPVLISNAQMAPMHKLQRPGLLLANGNIYVGIGSMQDRTPYNGMLFAFNAATLAEENVWVVTPTGSEGGIWMGGAAPAIDENGDVYVSTGNGTFDGTANFGESAVKFTSALQMLDYFAPYNFDDYDAHDMDLGSGDVMVVPDQSGLYPHELIVCGKPSPIYVLNRDDLGHVGSTSDNVIQRLDNEVGVLGSGSTILVACLTAPAMWGQNVYFGGKNDVLKMFTLSPSTGMLSSSPVSQGTLIYGYPGADPVVSSNRTTNGIAWTIDTGTNSLIANDATNLSTVFYSGVISGGALSWTVPTVVNGHVYAAGKGEVFGFGLK